MKPRRSSPGANSGRLVTSNKHSGAAGAAGAVAATSAALTGSNDSSQGILRKPTVVPKLSGTQVDWALGAIASGQLDSAVVLQVLSLLPNRGPTDLLLFPIAYRDALEYGGYVDHQARFTKDDIVKVHQEMLRRNPETLQDLLRDYEGRIVPPCPPMELRTHPDEVWAQSMLRDAIWFTM